MRKDWLLEVIVTTPEEAREAEAGGADRLEIVRDLPAGGLTPAINVVRSILEATTIPARAMLRATPDFVVGGEAERRRMIESAEAFSGLALDGLVLGFLEGRRIDLTAMRELLEAAPSLNATFHRAFEALEDRRAGIEALKTLPQVDRILASGTARELEAWRRAALPEIELLAGGGMTVERIRDVRAATGLREFHVGSAVREPPHAGGVVRADLVRGLRSRIEDL